MRTSCACTTRASTVSSRKGRQDSHCGTTCSACGIALRCDSQSFPSAEIAFSVALRFSSLRASGAWMTRASAASAPGTCGANAWPTAAAMTPTPYTEACRTSASASSHPARHGPTNASKYRSDAPFSLACSKTSSKTHTAILRSSGERSGASMGATYCANSGSIVGNTGALSDLRRLPTHSAN